MYTKNYGRTIYTISIAAYLVLDHVSLIKATSEGKRQHTSIDFFVFQYLCRLNFHFFFFFKRVI